MAKKQIPDFKNEDEEFEFWSTHDVVDYMDELGVDVEFPNLKPSTKVISLRLPESLLDRIKAEANMYDVPYQSLMKIKLNEIFGYPASIKKSKKSSSK